MHHRSNIHCFTEIDQIKSHLKTKDGRVEAVLYSDTRIFVIEYKFNKSSAEALDQIHRKEYYKDATIMGSKLPILLLGINLNNDVNSNKRIEISYELLRDSSL